MFGGRGAKILCHEYYMLENTFGSTFIKQNIWSNENGNTFMKTTGKL